MTMTVTANPTCPRCCARLVQAYRDSPRSCIMCGYEDYGSHTEIDLSAAYTEDEVAYINALADPIGVPHDVQATARAHVRRKNGIEYLKANFPRRPVAYEKTKGRPRVGLDTCRELANQVYVHDVHISAVCEFWGLGEVTVRRALARASKHAGLN